MQLLSLFAGEVQAVASFLPPAHRGRCGGRTQGDRPWAAGAACARCLRGWAVWSGRSFAGAAVVRPPVSSQLGRPGRAAPLHGPTRDAEPSS